jgi:hypothetical protein
VGILKGKENVGDLRRDWRMILERIREIGYTGMN